MSEPRFFIVDAHFESPHAARVVKRYLPGDKRAALPEDVPKKDRELYRVIENLESASVETNGAMALRCSFDFEGVEDPDEEIPRILKMFRSLGAECSICLLIDSQSATVYTLLEGGKIARLVPGKRYEDGFEMPESEDAAFTLGKRILARRGLRRWTRAAASAPRSPDDPLLVILG